MLYWAAALVGEAGAALVAIVSKGEKLHKELTFILALVAAGGYAIERIGDDVILEALKTPRSFKDAAAQHRVVEAISNFPGTPYVWVQVAEMEVIFERAFLSALKEGGWKGENAGIEGNDVAKLEELAAAGARGIKILYDPSRSADFKGPSEALMDALKKEGIAASAGVIPSEAGLPAGVIHIQIGPKQ